MNHTIRRRVLIGLAPLAAAMAFAGCASNATTEGSTSTSQGTVSTDESSETSAGTTDGTTTEATTDATSTYIDGTYSADGSYVSPGGTETVGVELTIADGVVTAVTVTPGAENPTSAQYQEQFAAGVSAEVVGVALDELEVDKVAGSSLTSGGFDNAVAQIAEQADA